MTLPPSGYGPPPPGPQSVAGQPVAPETEAKAVVALVLAIAAYTPVVPFVGAIAALVLAHLARRDIARSGGRKTGLGLCRWATWLSVVHLVLVGLLFLLFLLAIVLGFGITLLGFTVG